MNNKSFISNSKFWKLFLCLCAVFQIMNMSAQDEIPNASFENWETVSPGSPYSSYTEPVDWGTLNMLMTGVTQSTDAKVGSYSVKLESKTINIPGFGTFTTAELMSGDYLPALTSGQPKFGFPYAHKPTALTFWYKYIPSGTDTAQVYVKFKLNDYTSNGKNTKNVLKITNAVSEWTQGRIEFDFSNFSNDEYPDSCVIDITSSLSGVSEGGNGFGAVQAGSVLFIDGLTFETSNSNVTSSNYVKNGIYFKKTSSSAPFTMEVTSNESMDYSGNIDIPASVTFNDTIFAVTAIGDSAFYNCHNLNSVNIPYSVTTIYGSAFEQSGLNTVVLPPSLTSIWGKAFSNCYNLTTIYAYSSTPANLTTNGVFDGLDKSNCALYVVSKNAKTAYSTADEWNNFTKVKIISSVSKYIPNANFEKWETVTPAPPYNSYSEPVSWGTLNMFDNSGVTRTNDAQDSTYAARLESKSMNILSYGTFTTAELMTGDYMSALTTGEPQYGFPCTQKPIALTFWYKYTPTEKDTAQVYVELWANKNTNNEMKYSNRLEISDSVSTWKQGRIMLYNAGFSQYQLPDSCTIDITSSLSGLGKNGNGNGASQTGSVLLIDNLAFEMDTTSTTSTFVDKNIYYHITSDVSPYTVEVIQGDNPYNGSVTIPSKTTHNGKTYAVTAIGDSAFYNCYNLYSASIPSSVDSIKDYAFSQCSLSLLNLPESVTYFGKYAFAHGNISSITIPESVNYIGEYAFYNCNNLSKIYAYPSIPISLNNSDGVFDNTDKANCTLYVVSDNAKTLYAQAQQWQAFKNVKLISSVNSYIPNPSFENWETVEPGSPYSSYSEPVGWGTLNMLATTVTQSSDADDGGSSAKLVSKSFVIPGYGTFITSELMSGDYLSALRNGEPSFGFPCSKKPIALTFWYKYIPSGIDTATVSVELKANGNTNNERNFKNSMMVTDAVNTWKKGRIMLLSDNFSKFIYPDTCVIEFTSSLSKIANTDNDNNGYGASQEGSVLYIDNLAFEMDTTEVSGNYFVKDSIYYHVTSTSLEQTVPNNLKSVALVQPANTVEVVQGDEPYHGTVVIPATTTNGGTTYNVTTIGSNAFNYCSLDSVAIPSSVDSIKDYAFNGCTLSKVVIPISVKYIGDGVFMSCNNLSSAPIPSSVTHIGNSVFAYSGLTSIEIPSSLSYVSANAFFRCSNLIAVTLNSSLDSIKQEAFESCSNLTAIKIPASVRFIGSYAFGNCTSLSSVYAYPEIPVSLGSSECNNVFQGVNVPSCILYVVSESAKTLYENAFQWRDFSNIQAMSTSGVANNSGQMVDAKIVDGILVVKNAAIGSHIHLFNMQGMSLYKGKIDSKVVTVPLLFKGSYLLQIDNVVYKIVY